MKVRADSREKLSLTDSMEDGIMEERVEVDLGCADKQ